MLEEQFESVIRQKLEALELSVDPAQWEELLTRLHAAFDLLIRDKLESLRLPVSIQDWEAMQQQLDRAFDQAISQHLTQLQAPKSEAEMDWGQLNAQLDDMPLEALVAGKLSQAALDLQAADWDLFEAQLDEAPIDTRIRHSLEHLQAVPQSGDWLLMLDALENTFDEAVREALADLQLPATDVEWSRMAANLDESPFDTLVRERMTPLEMSYHAADWPLMVEQLEAPFDEALREKLGQLQYDASIKDWRAFSAMLDAQILPAEQSVAWYVNWRNYSAAAAVILLLLMTIRGGGDSWRLRSGEPLAVDSRSGFILPDIETSGLRNHTLTVNPPAVAQLEASSTTAVSEQNMSSVVDDSLPAATPLPMLAALSPLNELSSPLASNPEGSQTIMMRSAMTESKIPHESDPGALDAYLQQIDYSEIRRVGPVSFGENWLDDAVFSNQAPQSDFKPFAWKPDFRIGLYGSNARTFAELTGDHALSGYAYGLRIEMLLNEHLSVISGINYSEKRFRHTYPYFSADGRFNQNVLEGQLFLLEAPLLLRYQLGMNDKTKARFYVQGGVVAQISTQENYWHYNADNPVNLSLERSLQVRTLSPEKLERGFNTYAGNLHAGLGVDFPIVDRLSVQLEPYLLLGLQPTKGAGTAGLNKRLTTVGLGFGLIYDLQKLTPRP